MRNATKILICVLFLGASAEAYCQTWQFTGSLSSKKRTGVLTTLPNQTAIYVGGADPSGSPLTTCELYNPATGSWSLAASMAIPRERHTCTLLPDGRLVVIAGNTSPIYDVSSPTASIEIYDYVTNTWSSGEALSVARQNHTATLLLDGTILVVGGYTGSGTTASAEIYDPSTGTCKTVAPMILSRHDHSATLLNDGRVLVIGGRSGGSGSDYFTESEIYDPSTNTWTVVGNMAQARIKGSLITFSDGTVLASGGRNTPNTSAPGSEVFLSPFTSWTSTSAMFQPVTWQTSTLLPNDRFLVTGGIIDANWTSSFSAVTTPTCEWYDKPNLRWFYAPSMNQERSYHAACYMHQTVSETLPTDFVLVASGLIADNQFTETAEILNVTDDAILQYKAMPQNMAGVNDPKTSGTATILYLSPDRPELELSLTAAQEVTIDIFSTVGTPIANIDAGTVDAGLSYIPLQSNIRTPGTYFARMNIAGQNRVLKFTVLN